MTVYLFTPDSLIPNLQEIEGKLARLVPDLRKIKKIEEAAAHLGSEGQKTIVLFVSDGSNDATLENFIGTATRYRQNIFFILLSANISASDYKRLVQSGGADWVSLTGSLEEITEIINRQTRPVENSRNAAEKTRSNLIITFMPTAGGVGNTSVALETAIEIKQAKSTRTLKVCYLDLNFQTSQVCDYLDIQPRLHFEEILDRPERMDEQLLDLFVSHHSSGLDVFASPRSKLDPCEIGIPSLDALLDKIVNRYDILVIDLPVIWFGWTAPTIENSDVILLTAVNTVPYLRQLRFNLDSVKSMMKSSARLGVVVNRAEENLLGRIKRRRHVERITGDEKVFYVHEDRTATDRVNRGSPAALGGRSRMVKDIRQISDFCISGLAKAPAGKAPGRKTRSY